MIVAGIKMHIFPSRCNYSIIIVAPQSSLQILFTGNREFHQGRIIIVIGIVLLLDFLAAELNCFALLILLMVFNALLGEKVFCSWKYFHAPNNSSKNEHQVQGQDIF